MPGYTQVFGCVIRSKHTQTFLLDCIVCVIETALRISSVMFHPSFPALEPCLILQGHVLKAFHLVNMPAMSPCRLVNKCQVGQDTGQSPEDLHENHFCQRTSFVSNRGLTLSVWGPRLAQV